MSSASQGWRACIDHIIRSDSPCPVCEIESQTAENRALRSALHQAYLDGGCREDEATEMTDAVSSETSIKADYRDSDDRKDVANMRTNVGKLSTADARQNYLDDGFGNRWPKCGDSNCEMEIVRPGKVQCNREGCDSAVKGPLH